MKSKSYTNIIIILSICLLVFISICSCSHIVNSDKIYIDNKMHIIKSPFSSVKNIVIKNNKVLAEINPKEFKEYEILTDLKTNKQVLVKTNQMGKVEGPGGISDDMPFVVMMDSKHDYYDIDLDYKYNVDENDRIEFVYNGYGVIASYKLDREKLERYKKNAIEEGALYTRHIDNYSQHLYNYIKQYEKVYDLKNKKEIILDKSFDTIVAKNNNLIGFITDKMFNETYFKLNDEFKVTKEINLNEYTSLTRDKTKAYDSIVKIINIQELKYYVVKSGNYMYIVDSTDKALTKKYTCDFIVIMNSDFSNINEIIFVRKENDKYIYFNIEKDLFYTDMFVTSENPSKTYYINPATAKYLIGANDCYAIIDNNKVNIYNSISQNFIASVPFITIHKNDVRFYFSNFAVYGNFVYGKYVQEDDFQFIYGKNQKDYHPYTNVDVSDPFLYRVINKGYDEKHIKVLDGKCEVIQDRDTNKIYVIDNENLKNKRELPSITAKGFESFNCGKKTLYSISSGDYYDLYDANLNLIEKNVNFRDGSELIIYKKRDVENNYECIIINSSGELINKYYGFFGIGDALFLQSDDKGENVIDALHDANGKDIHKNIVYSISCKEGKEMPYFDLDDGRRITENHYLFDDGNKSFIIDNNAHVVKEFDAVLSFFNDDNVNGILRESMKNSDKMLYYFTYYKDGKGYNLLLDYKFNIILDAERKYQNDIFKVNFYDDCFAYVKDLQFYVQDYNRNIIYKGDIGNFTSY